MKIAKSIRLNGDIIEARHGNHRSCQYLNMVCCRCGEDVIFRQAHTREINGIDTPVAAAWVHRDKKSAKHKAECDLRVYSMTKKVIDSIRSEARQQRFKQIEKSYIAMNYKFNHIHFGSELDAGYTWKHQEKIARKVWGRVDYAAQKVCREVQAFLRGLSFDDLSKLVTEIYEQDIHTPYGITEEKLDQQIELDEFKEGSIPNFHLELCLDVLHYLAKKSSINCFRFTFGTFALIDNQYEILTIKRLAEMFVRRVVLTDWVSAFEWAHSKFAPSKGFAV